MTLASIMDEMYCVTEDKKISQLMTIDQSSAFDCLNHHTLLRKFKLYNLDEKVVKWMENYLSMRPQYVSVGASVSRMRSLKKGVTQGLSHGSIALCSVY